MWIKVGPDGPDVGAQCRACSAEIWETAVVSTRAFTEMLPVGERVALFEFSPFYTDKVPGL
jgi:hypothetical protein